MKKIALLTLFTVAAFTAISQNHTATKSEAAYYNKNGMLYTAMPAKFLGGNMDDFGARPGETSEGDKMDNCKTLDCYTLMATCTYGPPMGDAGFNSLRAERMAMKGTDDNSMKKRNALSYQEYNQYHLVIKLMVNFASGETFSYCQPGGYQKLTPPAGWDGWYLGSMENCFNPGGAQQGDISFIFMGAAPTIKETKQTPRFDGTPAFPINSADVSQFSVKNIVLYIQGSKELVADFVKNMDTAALRAMIQK